MDSEFFVCWPLRSIEVGITLLKWIQNGFCFCEPWMSRVVCSAFYFILFNSLLFIYSFIGNTLALYYRQTVNELRSWPNPERMNQSLFLSFFFFLFFFLPFFSFLFCSFPFLLLFCSSLSSKSHCRVKIPVKRVSLKNLNAFHAG